MNISTFNNMENSFINITSKEIIEISKITQILPSNDDKNKVFLNNYINNDKTIPQEKTQKTQKSQKSFWFSWLPWFK